MDRNHRHEGGFTLVELAVVASLILALSLSLLTVFSSSGTAVAEMQASAEADTQLLRVIDRIHEELDFADPELVTLVDIQTLTYSIVEGWIGYAPIHGPQRRLTLASDRLAIDGEVLVDGLLGGQMTLIGDRLEIEFTTRGEYLHDGSIGPVERRTVLVHRFGD